MAGVTALTEALAQGGRVVWDRDPPRLLVPPGLRPKVEADRATVREVLRRAGVFRGQLVKPGVYPFFHLPEARGADLSRCPSCGEPMPESTRLRCSLCVLAAWIALDWTPSPQPWPW